MKRILAVLLIMVLLLAACSSDTSNENSNGEENANNNEKVEPAENLVEAGITYSEDQEYKNTYSGEISTINYLVTSTTSEFGLAANFVDTLVDYDKYGVLQPSLAYEWSASEDGLVWTFKLRDDTTWVTYEGEEYAKVEAKDFVDSLEYIFNSENGSKTANIAYRVIKNAKAYYDGEITDFSEVGVKALDESTLEYTLEKPVPYFESMLTYACFFPVNGDFLTEMGERFGTSNDTILYNGSYIMEIFEPQNRRVLVANETYWDKENVFIKEIKYKYNKEAATIAQELFLRGDISSVSIPSSTLFEKSTVT